MQTHTLVLTSVVALLLGGLNVQGQTTDIVVSMKSDKADSRLFNLADMVESVEYIRVVDSSILLGNISDIKYWNGLFYLYDKSNQSIVVVNRAGDILSNISHRGRASSEYISLLSYAVGKTDGCVYIFDNVGRKILMYSKTGDYLQTIPLPEELYHFRDIEITPKGTILLYNPLWVKDRYDSLVELDSSGRILRTLFDNDKKHRLSTVHMPSDYFSVLSDGSITLMGREDRDLFYKITPEGNLLSTYHLVTDAVIPADLKNKETLSREDLSEGNYYEKVFYQETDTWLFFGVRYQRKTKFCIYDKKRGKNYVLKNIKDINDPFGTHITMFKRSSGPYLLTLLSNPESASYKRAESEVPPGENPIIVMAKTR